MNPNKEEYNQAVGYLKRYNYNCIKIIHIRDDLMSISGVNMDGLPKAPFGNSDPVFNTVIKLQDDKELNKCIKEYKIVAQAIQLVSEDAKIVFEEEYQKGMPRWKVIEKLSRSEETYKRRKRELIYKVAEEIKK